MASGAINRGNSGTNRAITEMDRFMLHAVDHKLQCPKRPIKGTQQGNMQGSRRSGLETAEMG